MDMGKLHGNGRILIIEHYGWVRLDSEMLWNLRDLSVMTLEETTQNRDEQENVAASTYVFLLVCW